LRIGEETNPISAELFLAGREKKINIEHRTSNIERLMGKDEKVDI
jgi:hypothetical protein